MTPPKRPSQPELPFMHERNPGEARRRRDQGVERAEGGADVFWSASAYLAGQDAARARPFISSDDLWDRVPHPREPRAIGPVMARLAREKIIAKIEEHTECQRPSRHQGMVRLWRSLIYVPKDRP